MGGRHTAQRAGPGCGRGAEWGLDAEGVLGHVYPQVPLCTALHLASEGAGAFWERRGRGPQTQGGPRGWPRGLGAL